MSARVRAPCGAHRAATTVPLPLPSVFASSVRRRAAAALLLVSGGALTARAQAVAPGRPSDAGAADSLTGRLDAAERYYVALGRVAEPAALARWAPDGDHLVYRAAAGAGGWLAVDAAHDAVRPWPGEPPAPAPDTPVTAGDPGAQPWRVEPSGPSGDGLAVLDSGGRAVVRLPGEPRYGWGLPPTAWSPDGRWLLAMRRDERAVHPLPLVDYTTALETTRVVPYAKPGTALPRTELHLIEPRTAQVRRVALDTGEAYVWPVGWTADGREALALRLTRDAKRLDLLAADARTGAVRVVVREERPATFVAGLDFAAEGIERQYVPLADGRRFLWLSERDGWRHVYEYDLGGRLLRQVTRGAFPVHRVAYADARTGAVYVVASADPARPYDRQLYRADRGRAGLAALTTAPGVHAVLFSPNGAYYLDRHSSVDRPPVAELRRADGRLVRVVDSADVGALRGAGYVPPEPFRALAADGTTPIYGVLYKPAGFEPGRRYPVVDYIYAGPWLSIYPASYAPTPQQRIAAALARMGYVVAVLDARGTPGRGKSFQDATYGRIGQLEIPDHVAALRQAAAARPYMDATRMGIAGHSWGGYFALRGMLTAPDVFAVGYAGAPGELTEGTLINEPYMGLIERNRAGYDAALNAPLAARLRGRLKLMHGTGDVNAPFSTTMRMADAFIRAGRPFDLLVMPGQPHNAPDPYGRYYREDLRRYFAAHLPP